jgi:hypothetical protein
LIGNTVLISVLQNRVQVLEPFTGEIVADHALVAPGETSIVDEHYGSSRPDKPRPAPRRKPRRRSGSSPPGEVAVTFLTGAAAAGVAHLRREIGEILILHAAHGETALLAALQRAVEFKRWRADDVRCRRTTSRVGCGLWVVVRPHVSVSALVIMAWVHLR